jgi:hypothetical protein
VELEQLVPAALAAPLRLLQGKLWLLPLPSTTTRSPAFFLPVAYTFLPALTLQLAGLGGLLSS